MFNFLTGTDDVLLWGALTAYAYLRGCFTRLGVPDPALTLKALLDAFQAALAATKEPDSGETTTLRKNKARKVLVDGLRDYANRYLIHNPNVTDEDRKELDLHQNKPRSKIPKPEGQVAVALSYPGGPYTVAVHLGPQQGAAELDPRGDYGYAIYIGKMPPGGATLEQAASSKHYLMTPPVSGDDLQYYKFTRKKKEVVVFDPHESGMTAYICSRYENQKGDVGNWGKIVAIIVP
jgi:hypothetical protein